ncbi:hypothetical protein ACFLRW_01325 [Acidobacteriota bacterium]
MLVDIDGSEIDWIGGYEPPPDKMLDKLEKSAKGIDTVRSLKERFEKNAQDAEAVFKLALKYQDRIQDDKALEKFKLGVSLDPGGDTGVFRADIEKVNVTCTEYTEYKIAADASQPGKDSDTQSLNNFIVKYPESELLYRAYRSLATAMARATEEKATEFFEAYVKKYPEDPDILGSWLSFIIKTKHNLEKGAELAEKIFILTRYKSISPSNQNLADLYRLQEDSIMAEQVYGDTHISSHARIFASNLIQYADYWSDYNTS